MTRSYKIEGIIIKRQRVGETDNLITVFSKNFGKLILKAKGARKVTSRKSPYLEPYNHVYLYVVKGKTIDIITEVVAIESFSIIRSKLDKIAYGFKIIEVINRLLPERQPSELIFSLLVRTLKQLDKENSDQLNQIIEEFANQLLWGLGYLPKTRKLYGNILDLYLQQIMEKKIYSNNLLTKISQEIE